MMLTGRIYRDGKWWAAEAPLIGVHTQGATRAEAEEMLTDAVEEQVHVDGFRARVARVAGEAEAVLIEGSEPSLLAARILRYQREDHGLSMADVQKRLGAASKNAYAAYEQGKKEPTLSKYLELLAAVAPELGLAVTTRKGA